MNSFLLSTGIVALAEVGDKTQLLSLLLAARFRKPVPIILGIFAATLLNHAAAGALGAWLDRLASPEVMRWVLCASFLGMAVWMLIPDKLDEEDAAPCRLGVFGTTAVVFFIAEMGDKTQIATVALAAQYPDYLAVVAGTTLGMMIANVPAVLLGERVTRILPVRAIHVIAALIFLALGIMALFNVGDMFTGDMLPEAAPASAPAAPAGAG